MTGPGMSPFGHDHLLAHARALLAWEPDVGRLEDWGGVLAARLLEGGRLLAAGNGGSAAQAQHLTSELVGRYRGERQPLGAIALHADTSSLTAIGNDYGFEQVFARQVHAYGHPGDVLLVLSTSGRSANLLQAVRAASLLGMETWGLTGPAPNPLERACRSSLATPEGSAATVQELHLVAVHLLCGAVDAAVARLAEQATGVAG